MAAGYGVSVWVMETYLERFLVVLGLGGGVG